MTSAALVRYEAARHALRGACSVDEVKGIRDKAVAMEAYARQAQDTELQQWAGEIRLRAERRAGELLAGMDKATGGGDSSSGTKVVPLDEPPTLSDLGVSKKESSRWQAVADIPEEEFEAEIEKTKQSLKVPSSAIVIREAKRKEKKAKNAELKETNLTIPVVQRKYHCIVIDPPWPTKKIDRDERPRQAGLDYPTMVESELENFKIPTADHCHLFMWTTQKFMPMGLRLLDAWGFGYVLTMVWHKPGGFQPFGLPQYNCEFVLYARKGAPEFRATENFFCCFDAPRREHSRKPDEFYETIRRVCDGPRIDIFSRGLHGGFDRFGNETDKFEGTAV